MYRFDQGFLFIMEQLNLDDVKNIYKGIIDLLYGKKRL